MSRSVLNFLVGGMIALGFVAQCSATTSFSSVASNFNATTVPSGDYIWFTAVGKLTGADPNTPFSLFMTNSVIDFTSTDSSKTVFSISAPDAVLTFGPSGTAASESFSSGKWHTTAAVDASGNQFLDGVAFLIPSGIDISGANPVTWSANFTTNAGSTFTFNWAWAAAAYTSSCTSMGSTSTYGSLNVIPTDGANHSGTPQACGPSISPNYLEPGARGGGGSNWTGSLSGTLGVDPSSVVPEPGSGTTFLLGVGLIGVGGLARRGFKSFAR